MNRHDRVNVLLGAYLDGELSEADSTLVEAELEGCSACQQELEGLVAMGDAFRAPVLAAAQAASFDGMWERIEAQIGAAQPTLAAVPAEAAPRRAVVLDPEPGLLRRLAAAWQNVFGAQPLLPAAFAAALVVAVAVALLLPDGKDGGGTGTAPGAGSEISALSPGSGAPKGPAVPDETNNRAWVSSVEYTRGTVIIDQVSDDPSEPTIVWHYDDELSDQGTQGG